MKLASRVETSKIDWTKFKFMVYDIPNMNASYAERYSKLGNKISPLCESLMLPFIGSILGDKEWIYLELAPKAECRDTSHLDTYFQDIIDKGGEGIILRDPSAPYQPGRSSGYLKHKALFFSLASSKILQELTNHFCNI